MYKIDYIMVTDWRDHWDRLDRWNFSTLFTLPMIKWDFRNEKPKEGAEVLFIKRSKEGVYENAWLGSVSNFRSEKYKGKDCIRFDISGLHPSGVTKALRDTPNGWHKFPDTDSLPLNKANGLNTSPGFFKLITTCGWEDFENYCYMLLRLLGIHNIHRFPQTDNRGKADGFFKFENLTVMYDATLDPDVGKKEQQIDNYIAQLKRDKLRYGNKGYVISETQRQVWIITRDEKSKLVLSEDQIRVKIVPVSRLMDIYHQRLEEEIGAEELMNLLRDI